MITCTSSNHVRDTDSCCYNIIPRDEIFFFFFGVRVPNLFSFRCSRPPGFFFFFMKTPFVVFVRNTRSGVSSRRRTISAPTDETHVSRTNDTNRLWLAATRAPSGTSRNARSKHVSRWHARPSVARSSAAEQPSLLRGVVCVHVIISARPRDRRRKSHNPHDKRSRPSRRKAWCVYTYIYVRTYNKNSSSPINYGSERFL